MYFKLLKYTKGYIKKLRLQSQSLAESFELSQANRIADALKPMIILYIVCAVLIAPGGVFCFYLLFIEDTPYSNKLYFVGMRMAEEQDGHFSYLTDSWKMAEAKGQKSRVTSPTAKYFVQ
ncbi:unnamed protein product [Bursaphelenchus okinawaensis]|uniref:Uncharacterized protein n=1 Tax=Bursaphelenchus okinawaensis TaxID=465554 RepID=A0A811KTR1_9BILA|nr:unnamed protein product [Bursaphelenchus okinawaensis]CAG9111189.1 unnamed protein product [Bursaphelenchus okinawaensis]